MIHSLDPALILKVTPKKLGVKPVPLPGSLSQALIATEYGSSKVPEQLNAKLEVIKAIITDPVCGRGIRSIGSAALSMCLIAQGVVDVYYEVKLVIKSRPGFMPGMSVLVRLLSKKLEV
jgi:hypothetical protein